MDARTLLELDHREGDGIEVSLLWQASDNSVYLAVVDHHLGDRFTERVDPATAREAFQHPYAHRRSTIANPDRRVGSRSRSTGASRNF
jgi:hypothetical protein